MKKFNRIGRVINISMTEKTINGRALLDINGFCEYLGIGKTKARELLKTPRNGFSIKLGAKWYVHKDRLDAWLLNQCDKS